MAAAPHAYDDLASVYAAETSVRRLHGWHPLAQDRSNNRRAALGDVERRHDADPQTALVEQVSVPETVAELSPPFFKNPERVKRASTNGGAANKARWAKIKAAQVAKEAA